MLPTRLLVGLAVLLLAGASFALQTTRAAQDLTPGVFNDAPADLSLDAAFALLRNFEVGQSRQPVNLIQRAVYQATADAPAAEALRARLLAALQEPGSTYMCKELICHDWLPLLAGDETVPTLVKMLADQRAGLLAVDALQRMPGAGAAQALRDALTTTSGNVRLMVIQAVGQRGDAAALPSLAGLTRAGDAATRRQVLGALGAIGSREAAAALLQSRDDDELAWTEAVLQCAQRRLGANDRETAAGLCQTLLSTARDVRTRMAALTGLAAAQGSGAIAELRAALASHDPALIAHAAELLADLAGAAITQAMLEGLDTNPDARIPLLRALGKRGDPAARTAAVRYVHAEDAALRCAAIETLGRLGDASTVELLTGIAAAETGAPQAAARTALLSLRDAAVDGRLGELLHAPQPLVRAEAIRSAAGRQRLPIKAELFERTKDESDVVRDTAFESLGELVAADDYPAVIRLVVTPAFETDRPKAVQVVRAAARRIPDPLARTTPLLAALKRSDAAVQAALLPVLADTGGDAALNLLVARAASANTDVQDVAVRVLADWPEPTAMPHLLSIVRSAANPKHCVLATRGYLRLFPRADDPAGAARAILPLVPTQEKPQLVSGLAQASPSPELLRLAVELLSESDVKTEAAVALERIAAGLVEQQPDAVLAALVEVRAQDRTTEVSAALTETERAARALSQSIHERIDPRMPNGYRIACYLNAGVATRAAAPHGATIRQMRGASWRYTPDPDPVRTVAFDPQYIEFAISGLEPTRRYVLGLTWWDVDNNGRVQSLALAPGDSDTWVPLLPRTRPVAWHADQATYAVLHVPITADQSAPGSLRVRIQREGPSNAVVSEVWLLERPAADPALKRIVIVTGDDYPGHRWRETAPELAAILREDPRLEVTIVESPAILGSTALTCFDAVVLHLKNYHERMPMDPAQCAALAEFVRSGRGLLVTHFACGAFPEWDGYVALAGRVWNPQLRGHDPHGPFEVRIVDREHPITRGMSDFEAVDELYTCLDGKTPIHVLCEATSQVDKLTYPMAFTVGVGAGRVCQCVLGHDVSAYQAPGPRALYRRATAWVAALEPGPGAAASQSAGAHD